MSLISISILALVFWWLSGEIIKDLIAIRKRSTRKPIEIK
jgi:hypothetical protein